MARRMKANNALRAAWVAALFAAGVASVHAQVLRDPTRPPGRSAIKAAPGSAQGGLVLQSILISPERKAAVISGKVVGPGETVEGYMLVGIAEDVAVLKNGDKIQRLRLYPAVDMKRQKDASGGSDGVQPGSGDRQ
jgi:MSHA biogenesis protein MshK